MAPFSVHLDNFAVNMENPQYVKFSGELMDRKQLEPLKNALTAVEENLNKSEACIINLVDAGMCISYLLRPMLNWARDLPHQKKNILLYIASEDGYVVPWHNSFKRCLEDSNYAEKACRL